MISIEAAIALLDKSTGTPQEWARVDEKLSWRAFHEHEKLWCSHIGSRVSCLCSLRPYWQDRLTSRFERSDGNHAKQSKRLINNRARGNVNKYVTS